MTDFTYRPQYEWWGWWDTPDGLARYNFTPLVLRYQVKFGCEWNARKAACELRSAKGHLVLENANNELNLDGPIFMGRPPTGPIRMGYGISGQRFTWSGLCLPRPAPPLQDDDRLAKWELRGRWWQGLQHPLPYREPTVYDNATANVPISNLTITPAEFMGDLLERMADIVGTNSQNIRATLEGPRGVEWLWPYVSGTGAQNINVIARNAASVAYETPNGSIGMKPFQSVLDERLSAPAPPAGQQWLRRRSKAQWEIRTQPWAVRVTGPVGFSRGPADRTITFNIEVDADDWDNGQVAVEGAYSHPNDVYGIIWNTDRTVYRPSTWRGFTISVEPLRVRKGDIIRITGSASANQPTTTIAVTGDPVLASKEQRVLIDPEGADQGGAQSIIDLPPWMGWDDINQTTNLWRAPYIQWMACANRTMLRVEAEYPLWGAAEGNVIPVAQRQPGDYVQQRAASNLRYGGMVETVEYLGERGRVPTVRVRTLDLSGVHKLDAEDDNSDSTVAPPPRVFPPDIPDNTPTPPPPPGSGPPDPFANSNTVRTTIDFACATAGDIPTPVGVIFAPNATIGFDCATERTVK